MLTEQQIQECDRAIAAVAQGDTQALATVYDCMARDIFVAVLAITQSHADAEDALQDTMLQIVKYAFSYRPGSNPRAWILTIARHRALDIVRLQSPVRLCPRQNRMPLPCWKRWMPMNACCCFFVCMRSSHTPKSQKLCGSAPMPRKKDTSEYCKN